MTREMIKEDRARCVWRLPRKDMNRPADWVPYSEHKKLKRRFDRISGAACTLVWQVENGGDAIFREAQKAINEVKKIIHETSGKETAAAN